MLSLPQGGAYPQCLPWQLPRLRCGRRFPRLRGLTSSLQRVWSHGGAGLIKRNGWAPLGRDQGYYVTWLAHQVWVICEAFRPSGEIPLWSSNVSTVSSTSLITCQTSLTSSCCFNVPDDNGSSSAVKPSSACTTYHTSACQCSISHQRQRSGHDSVTGWWCKQPTGLCSVCAVSSWSAFATTTCWHVIFACRWRHLLWWCTVITCCVGWTHKPCATFSDWSHFGPL